MSEQLNSNNTEEEVISSQTTDEVNEAEFDDEAIVTLIDDEGRKSEFEVLDAIETEEGRFVALLPLASVDEDSEEAEYIILQVVTNDDGEEELAELEDEELLDALADVFMERFQELYE